MSEVFKYRNFSYRFWICAVLLFVISLPRWVWNMSSFFCLVIVPFILLIFAIPDLRGYKNGLRGIIALVFQLYIVYVYFTISTTNQQGRFEAVLKALAIAPLFFCSPQFWKKCTDCYIRLLAVILVFALIEHILISFFGIRLTEPSQYECPYNGGRLYYGYLFNVYIEETFGFFNRFYAFFDEPGVLGNIMMVLLYVQKFDLRKWYNIVFLISGVLSFSLTFYIAVILYYVIFGKMWAKIAFAVLSIGFVYYFYNNEYVFDLIFNRMSFENGTLVGYNRENLDFENWFFNKKLSDYLFIGHQPREAIPYAASWKWALTLWGVIPSVLYLVSIVMCTIKKNSDKKTILSGLLVMAIVWIQRPFVYLYLYVFLIVLPFIYSNEDEKNQEIIVS